MAPNEERTRNNLIYSDIPLQSMRFLGHTTNTLSPSNGPSYIYTNSPHIYMDDGNAVCAETGDVVLDNDGRYFVYYLDRWVELEDKTADALHYTIAVDIATKLCDHPEEINTSLSIGVTVTDPENTEELVPPDLSDLLSLDDEQYKTKFNCDYEEIKHKAVSTVSNYLPENFRKSIITFYNFYHLGTKNYSFTHEHSITDLAKFIVNKTESITRPRLNNLCYILIATLAACDIYVTVGSVPVGRAAGIVIPTLECDLNENNYWITLPSFKSGDSDHLCVVEKAFAARVIEEFLDYPLTRLTELVQKDGVWCGIGNEIDPFKMRKVYHKYIFGD